jgi:hypothetical protein
MNVTGRHAETWRRRVFGDMDIVQDAAFLRADEMAERTLLIVDGSRLSVGGTALVTTHAHFVADRQSEILLGMSGNPKGREAADEASRTLGLPMTPAAGLCQVPPIHRGSRIPCRKDPVRGMARGAGYRTIRGMTVQLFMARCALPDAGSVPGRFKTSDLLVAVETGHLAAMHGRPIGVQIYQKPAFA